MKSSMDKRRVADLLLLFVDGSIDRAIVLLDTNGAIVSCSAGAEQMFGWGCDDMIGRSASVLYARSDGNDLIAGDLEQARRRAAIRVKRWCVRRDGSELIGDVSIVALTEGDGGGLAGYGIGIANITHAAASEQALRQSELHLRSILATIPDAMIVIDNAGIILSFSSAAERMFGYSETEVAGRNVSLLMPSPYREQHDDYIARYETTGERRIIGIGRVVTGLRRDGTEFPMELTVGEARDGAHRIFTGFVRDLTAQQLAELRMRELQSELIHVSRVSAMGTMASTLAHELNQPLTAVANYLEAGRDMIGRTDDDARALLREAMVEAARETLRAGQIVRRLRDFVARRDTDRAVQDLPALIEEAARLGMLGATERGIRLFTEFDPQAQHVLADRIQIQQVLVNLLRNAAEAVSASEVREIRVATRRRDDTIEVTVADTGPGIAPDILPRLFEAFASDKDDGMGLGLSISRTIVESHGGRIWAEPAIGGGTVFHFTLWSGDPEGEDD